MKFKFSTLSILCLISTLLWSQNSEITTNTIIWKGVETWNIGSSTANVVSFKGAKYPTDDQLPYFNKRINYEPRYNYSVEIVNPIFTNLTSAETSILNSAVVLNSSVKAETTILESRNDKYLDINILPFISTNGVIQKLKSFDLQINKELKAQRVSTTTNTTSKHQYTDNSILAQGKFVKIRLTQNGIYKLTYEDLNSMGINPSNVRIFGYGGALLEQNFNEPKKDDLPELAIYMNKGTDGIFNSGDYILFYGQGINNWKYDSNKGLFSHNVNYYSNYGYYFVSSDAGIGKKIEEKTEDIPQNAIINTINEFTDYKVYEKDLRNIIGGDSQKGSGKEFYGEIFNSLSTFNINFYFPNSVLANNSVKVKLDVAAISSETSNFNLSLNSEQTSELYVPRRNQSDKYEVAKGTYGIFNFTPKTDSYIFNLNYNKTTSTSVGFLNYLEVNARCKLIMNGASMQFQNVDYLGTNTYNNYQLDNINEKIEIWDITDHTNISKVATQSINNKLSFTAPASALRTYIAINPTLSASFAKPEILSEVPNQNLHALAPVDMVILTHPNFRGQAELLAQAHRDIDKLTVEVVTTEQVYNEFSSGTPDATAYRWVMKMLYDRANSANDTINCPKYLLLFGRGTYDNRKIQSNSGDNFILTYQTENSLVITLSYITDDYFGLLDDNEGTSVPSNLLDIGVGRFPVTTSQEATVVVNKTIDYMKNKEKGNWKNQICFLADDGDGALHMRQADSIASTVARANPAFQINKIHIDTYKQDLSASGETYPLAKNKLQNLFRTGMLLFNFTGHAAPSGLTNEELLTANDVKKLSNKNLPLFIGATCDFLQFDIKSVSGGEHVLLNPAGGGIGILSAARPVYASQNMTLNKLFCEQLFTKKDGEYLRIGDALRNAKNRVGTEINKLSYIYMGDPALKLNYPTKYKILTTKINENTNFGVDTLRSLSLATIEGCIANDNGDTITDFNGSVHVVIYDKIQKITTQNNDKDASGAFTYFDRPNPLFAGEAKVKNGVFIFTFMLPKDIKYNYGTGRINYYAADEINDYEAQGYFENFLIGGTNKNAEYETVGPETKIFLNSTNFMSGDKVNETPLFFAQINDLNGINTVGSGIGHDITITIDNDPLQSYVLNDYFQATENSYKSGTVSYKLPELVNGKHTLTFKVWDLLNNSTSTTIEFEVVKDLQPVIFSVSNFPNPVKANTNIVVSHDRPETILNTTVEIFDLAGRKIWAFSQASANNISWDLIGGDGNRVQTGIYLYRVSIKTKNSDTYSKTNKMLIVEQ